ncbi:MAG: molybdate ABC transporter permease subunit [Gammaproteobacteria bacterium]
MNKVTLVLSLTAVESAALLLSLKVALWCTAFVSVPAVLIAWTLARKHFPGKALFDGVVHLPLILPPVVPGYLLLVLLGNQGVLGKWLFEYLGLSIAFTWKGAVVASAVMALPLMVRAVRLSIELIDLRYEQVAATLGAHPLRVFLTITLPLALPGILAGMILAFSRSLGEFGATITFVGNIPGETQTLPLAIYSATQRPGGDEFAFRLVVLSILLSLGALIASDLIARRVQRRLAR